MAAHNRPQELEKAREQIARKVRELRTERKWTQQELARRLDLSQSRLSELERGDGSFTAEQLLEILALFNVPATHFATHAPNHDAELQNALARHGATHLRESTDVLPSEKLEELTTLVREVLISQSSRQLTALAPVLVSNAGVLGILTRRLAGSGLERRFGWVLENTLVALNEDLNRTPRGLGRQYRNALYSVETALSWLSEQVGQLAPGPPDVLDPIASKRTRENVEAAASPISRHWGILTDVQPRDFTEALRDGLVR